MFLCRSCQRYLRSTDFSPAVSTQLSGRCQDCTRLDNIARSRNDFSCYKNILQRLRADEQRLNKDAKIPFLLQVTCYMPPSLFSVLVYLSLWLMSFFYLTASRRIIFVSCLVCLDVLIVLTSTCVSLQVEDVRYLVEVVWASCSALHASSDIYNLVFVRWEHKIDWSPWNCILLSKEETSAHLEVQDVHKVCPCKHLNPHHTCKPHHHFILKCSLYLDMRIYHLDNDIDKWQKWKSFCKAGTLQRT